MTRGEGAIAELIKLPQIPGDIVGANAMVIRLSVQRPRYTGLAGRAFWVLRALTKLTARPRIGSDGNHD